MITGVVGNIQKYSIHDGPGIRSTIFLKGCPLACLWCHNPENLSFQPQVIWQEEKCIGCGDCQGLHGLEQSELCPALALEALGKTMTVEQAAGELLKDAIFYESSGGGITLSGGEPLGQPEFTLALLRRLKAAGLHTAMDTCGHGPWEILRECAAYTDLFLYDIKHLDGAEHKRLTGLDNTLILENLQGLARLGAEIWLRMPLLPGLNDAPGHLQQVAELGRKLGLRELYLLPYHHLAMGKYAKLGLSYQLTDLPEPSPAYMEELRQSLQNQGLNVHIGG